MAAPSDPMLNISASSKSRKSLLFRQIIILFCLLLANVFLLLISDEFNLIKSSVSSLKSFSFVYGCVQLCLGYVGVGMRENEADVSYRFSPKTHGRTSSILKGFLVYAVSCVIFHIVAVLFGAPLQESVEETFLFAVLVSTLSTLPCLCVFGTNGDAWNRLIVQKKPYPGLETCVQYVVVGSLFGAWLGAVPIPLDWDRPWQIWPVSCSIGALWGHTLGHIAGLIHVAKRQQTKTKGKH
ncbi:phosphatidylinositol-glycan biosynthesis class F protein-like [Amphiura filiformis]|uniref:phosphatidylinositol-glycan biosynthesis class F protein-like n=1 Tax=Amphiura filiformis TaxID=82378 RepID=UPI003B20D468